MEKLVSWGWPANKIHYWNSLMVGHRVSSTLFDSLWKRQNGRCVGCEGAFAHPARNIDIQGLQPRIDRRPNEPKDQKDVRGLLCGECRSTLHELLKDSARKQKLINYLRLSGDWND